MGCSSKIQRLHSPVLTVKMVSQVIPDLQGPRASMKGSLALVHAIQKTDVKYLWNAFRTTNRQRVPINFRILPMHLAYVCRHQSHGKFYSTVWAVDSSSRPLVVRPPLTVQRHPIASSSIQDLIVPGWYVLVLDFVTFNTILYRSKRPMSTFIMPKSHYSYCDTTTPLSA